MPLLARNVILVPGQSCLSSPEGGEVFHQALPLVHTGYIAQSKPTQLGVELEAGALEVHHTVVVQVHHLMLCEGRAYMRRDSRQGLHTSPTLSNLHKSTTPL